MIIILPLIKGMYLASHFEPELIYRENISLAFLQFSQIFSLGPGLSLHHCQPLTHFPDSMYEKKNIFGFTVRSPVDLLPF